MRKAILCIALVFGLTACNTNTLAYLGCVIKHESGNTPDPTTAQNPTSSASGLYQFLDSTWRSLSRKYGVHGYSKARHAPGIVQTYVAYRTVEDGGKSHWAGTGC